MMYMWSRNTLRQQWVSWLLLIVVYLAAHLPSLTLLPLFADEAIYIRWAQLILSDWQQYFFFPLNDGKTPLFIWMLVPFLRYGSDPLFAGRLLSVIGGLSQMVLLVQLLRQMKVNRVGQLIGALIVTIAPFWFFHHRMVLMDGWLTVWLSLATLAVLKVLESEHARRRLVWQGIGAVAVWAGLMTKIPFVLALPSLGLLAFINGSVGVKDVRKRLSHIALPVGGGIALFLLLALSPVFPQLLHRGSDFLLPIAEVVSGRWQETVPSIPTYLGYFVSYAGWGMFVLATIGLVHPGKRRMAVVMMSSFVLFSLPIWILGKVVYPRYLFPAMLYVTLAASIGAGTLWQWSIEQVHTVRRRQAIRLLLGLLVAQIGLTGIGFIGPSLFASSAIPFVSSDRSQYLTTWSSGHGLREAYAVLQKLDSQQAKGSIIVATEGSFGSLPDGLLLYNFRRPLQRVWIEGIGYPVRSIPVSFVERVQSDDLVLLVINSDRVLWQLDENDKIAEYCRPFAGPCLQIWDITSTYSQFKKN